MNKLIKSDQKCKELALETLDYLKKKISSSNKNISLNTAKNINNLILPRIKSDQVLKDVLGNDVSNKVVKKYCKEI